MLGLGLGRNYRGLLGAGGSFSENSLLLDGVDELATAGNVTSFDAGDAFSVSFWINFTSTTASHIFGKAEPSGNFRGWNVLTDGAGGIRWQIIESASTKRKTIDTNLTFNDGNWHHVVCTKSTGATIADLNIYVDGVLQSVTPASDVGTVAIITNTEELTIGARGSSGTYNAFYNGLIDDLILFNAELTQSNVDSLYNNGCPKDESATANVVSYWRMGDGTGDNWNDDTPNEWVFIDQVGANNQTTVNCEFEDVVNNAPCLSAPYSENSLYLDGTNEYATANGVATSLTGDTVGTWSAWVNLATITPATTMIILSSCDTDANTRVRFRISTNGQLNCDVIASGTTQWRLNTVSAIGTANQWVFLCLVQDGVSPVLYVDGVNVPQTFSISSDTTAWYGAVTGVDNFLIGAELSNSTPVANFYNGLIDEITIFNTALSASDITNIYNGGCPKDESARAGLVSYWRMGDGTGDNWNVDNPNEWTFIDQKGTNDATTVNCEQNDVVDVAPCTTRFTRKSLYLDGTNEIVNTDSLITDIETTTNGTMSFWMQTPDATPLLINYIVTFSLSTALNDRFGIYLSTAGKIGVALVQGGTVYVNLVTDSAVISDNTWHHVCITQNGTAVKIYVDGVEPAQTEAGTDATKWLNQLSGIVDNGRIGALNYNSSGDTFFYTGNITDVLFLNTALTENEVQDIWNAGCPKDETEITGGVSYYRMGNADGDNFNSGVANEWQFIDQINLNDAYTDNCELDSVEAVSPC